MKNHKKMIHEHWKIGERPTELRHKKKTKENEKEKRKQLYQL